MYCAKSATSYICIYHVHAAVAAFSLAAAGAMAATAAQLARLLMHDVSLDASCISVHDALCAKLSKKCPGAES